jgi:hypothetical protein
MAEGRKLDQQALGVFFVNYFGCGELSRLDPWGPRVAGYQLMKTHQLDFAVGSYKKVSEDGTKPEAFIVRERFVF